MIETTLVSIMAKKESNLLLLNFSEGKAVSRALSMQHSSGCS